MKTEINKTVNELKKFKKVVAIILFGSYAKKKTKPLSDVDIAVIMKNPDKKIEAEVASFHQTFLIL
jgi:predicted nucleotidyltransferase